MTDDEKKAVRDATLAVMGSTRRARLRHEWAFNDCLHERYGVIQHPDHAVHICADCGAERVEFVVVDASLKAGEVRALAADNFVSAIGTKETP